MENNQSIFMRTFLVVLAFSCIVLLLLVLEHTIIRHAGTGMYDNPTPPYVAVIGRTNSIVNEPFSLFGRTVNHISSFLLYGN